MISPVSVPCRRNSAPEPASTVTKVSAIQKNPAPISTASSPSAQVVPSLANHDRKPQSSTAVPMAAGMKVPSRQTIASASRVRAGAASSRNRRDRSCRGCASGATGGMVAGGTGVGGAT